MSRESATPSASGPNDAASGGSEVEGTTAAAPEIFLVQYTNIFNLLFSRNL